MWTCQHCGEQIEDQFDSCWKCGPPRAVPVAVEPGAENTSEPAAPKWRLAYRVFRGTWTSWEELFTEASAFANEVGPERVLSISHSADHSEGVVTVWFWIAAGEPNPS